MPWMKRNLRLTSYSALLTAATMCLVSLLTMRVCVCACVCVRVCVCVCVCVCVVYVWCSVCLWCASLQRSKAPICPHTHKTHILHLNTQSVMLCTVWGEELGDQHLISWQGFFFLLYCSFLDPFCLQLPSRSPKTT